VRSVKHRFAAGKLPVRGLIRAQMVICGSALLVNVHRLCHHILEQAVSRVDNDNDMPASLVLSLFLPFLAYLTAICRRCGTIFEHLLAVMSI
jgi:hypothetical protein